MLQQLLLELHRPNLLVYGPQDEPAVFTAGERRAAGETFGVGLELVDERQRDAVAQPSSLHAERHADGSELRPAFGAGDALPDADHGRQGAARAPDVPQPVELTHSPSLPLDARAKRTSRGN